MTETAGPVSGVADRYAAALFELAIESRSADAVMADLDAFARMIEASPALARLVRSPVFTPDEQVRAVGALLDKAEIGGLAANFIRLAARNRRLSAAPEMIRSFRRRLAAHKGEASAEVISAEPLTDAQHASLAEALKAVTGKTVAIAARVDPALIGGLIVKLGSRMVDSSLRTKLSSLKVALKEVG